MKKLSLIFTLAAALGTYNCTDTNKSGGSVDNTSPGSQNSTPDGSSTGNQANHTNEAQFQSNPDSVNTNQPDSSR